MNANHTSVSLSPRPCIDQDRDRRPQRNYEPESPELLHVDAINYNRL